MTEKQQSPDADGSTTKRDGDAYERYYGGMVREYPFPTKFLYWFALVIVELVTKLYHRWSASGTRPYARRKDPGAKGRIIVANHASMLDPVVLIIDAATHGSYLHPLYKSEFDRTGIVKWFFAHIGGIPIRRGTADTKALRRAVRILNGGEDICIFPEGTRIRDVNARPEIHGGFALIAQMASCDIVPVAIEGSQNISPAGKGFPRPAKVRILYGEPLSIADIKGGSRRERNEELERRAMGAVYELRDRIRVEHGKPASSPQSDSGEAHDEKKPSDGMRNGDDQPGGGKDAHQAQ